jgi:hypothetical protein
MDFGALPPEVNSGRMYVGPGPATMLADLLGLGMDSVGLGTDFGGVRLDLFGTGLDLEGADSIF